MTSRPPAQRPEVDAAIDERRRVRHGVGILILSSILFGVMAVCVRWAARELPAMQIAWVRFSGSLVLLLGVARGQRLRPKANASNLSSEA